MLSVEPEQLDAAYNLALISEDRRDEPDTSAGHARSILRLSRTTRRDGTHGRIFGGGGE